MGLKRTDEFRSRPASRRQRSDMVTLAHIKEQSRLSLGSYGCGRWRVVHVARERHVAWLAKPTMDQDDFQVIEDFR